MATSDQTIGGGRELDDALRTLTSKIQKNIMRSALRAGANVFKEAAKANAPVKSGKLRKSLAVTTSSKGGMVTAKLKARGKVARHAHLVEFGTKPHKIAPKGQKGALKISGNIVGAVNHPGSKPKPFMRPAFDGKSSGAIQATAAQIRARLTQQGINTPAPEAS
jgi:HK97 gp10 family phage protein